MKKNVGNLDRWVRIILAALLLLLAVVKVVTGTLAVVLLIVAAVLLVTGLVNFCPIWKAIGVSTRKEQA